MSHHRRAPMPTAASPTKVGVAISDVATGMFGAVSVLAALWSGRDERRRRPDSPARVRAGGQRIDISLLGSTLASLVNQAQNAFVTGVAPGPARERPPEHRPLRDVRHRRWADRGRGRLRAAMAAVLRRRSSCRSSRPTARFATNGDRVEHRAELRPILAARFRERRPGDLAHGAGGGRDPVRTDPGHRRGLRVARGGRARDDGRAGAPRLGRHPPGRPPVPALAARPPRSGRRRRCSASTPTRSSPRWAGRRRRSRPSAPRGGLTGHSSDPAARPARQRSVCPALQLLAAERPGRGAEDDRDQDRGRDRRDQDVAQRDRRPGRQRDRRGRQPAGRDRSHVRHGRHDREDEPAP